jgi:hypothetical protein
MTLERLLRIEQYLKGKFVTAELQDDQADDQAQQEEDANE